MKKIQPQRPELKRVIAVQMTIEHVLAQSKVLNRDNASN